MKKEKYQAGVWTIIWENGRSRTSEFTAEGIKELSKHLIEMHIKEAKYMFTPEVGKIYKTGIV